VRLVRYKGALHVAQCCGLAKKSPQTTGFTQIDRAHRGLRKSTETEKRRKRKGTGAEIYDEVMMHRDLLRLEAAPQTSIQG
jgi:hypothetical protein